MVNILSVCFSTLFLANLAFAASGAPYIISNKRGGHGRVVNSIQRRAAADRAVADRSDFIVPAPRKRSTGRCSSKTTTSSSLAPTTTASTSTSAIGNPGGDPTTTTSTPAPTTTTLATTSVENKVHKTTTKTTTKAHSTTTKAAVKTTSAKKTTATTSVSSSGGGSGTTYSGQGTYYATGLGSCGITNKDTDLIAAVSHLLYDSWPGATANPNDNPICGRYATAHYQGKSVTVKITDRCTGCAMYDLDFSPSAFSDLADQSLGRIDITWQWD